MTLWDLHPSAIMESHSGQLRFSEVDNETMFRRIFPSRGGLLLLLFYGAGAAGAWCFSMYETISPTELNPFASSLSKLIPKASSASNKS